MPASRSLIYSRKAEISAWKFWNKTGTNNVASGSSGSGDPMLWELGSERVGYIRQMANSCVTDESQINLTSGLTASATIVHGDDDGNGLCFIITMRWCIAKAIWSAWKRLQVFIIILDGMSTNWHCNLIAQTDRHVIQIHNRHTDRQTERQTHSKTKC